MSKELIKLPKEVAKAIEKVWYEYGAGYTKHMVLTNWSMLKDDHTKEYNELSDYAHSYPIDYMRSLVNGYEVEMSPEDKVREYYQTQKAAVVNEHNYDKPTTAIRYVLECLNIKIDGVW